jgi:hypothetical protein
MASNPKRVRYDLNQVLAILAEDNSSNELDSDAGGMSSGEESKIDSY